MLVPFLPPMESEELLYRQVRREPRLVGGDESAQSKKIQLNFPGCPALWAGSITWRLEKFRVYNIWIFADIYQDRLILWQVKSAFKKKVKMLRVCL